MHPRRLVVFSHPNHEVAVFGLLQRWQPTLVYLTDGGGEDRVAQTRAGLARIGLLDHATFLDHAESAFYAGLIARDAAFFDGVARQVAGLIERVQPDEVLCDGVEYYNPVHDLSLPLVYRALFLAGLTPGRVRVSEIPLIRQLSDGNPQEYVVQRPSASRVATQRVLTLKPGEILAKRAARDEVYTLLAAQLGPVICDLPDHYLGTETTVPASLPFSVPADCALRYEWRAERLHEDGTITQMITYHDHFLPLARELSADWLTLSPEAAAPVPGQV